MDPATVALIATAVAAAAKSGGEALGGAKNKKASMRRAKETKRETYAGLLNDALQGSAELHGHGLATRSRLGKRRAQTNQNTADVVRGALNL